MGPTTCLLVEEAESNCRPLVFQVRANLLTLVDYNLFCLNIHSLLTSSRSWWTVNKTEFFSERVTDLRRLLLN